MESKKDSSGTTNSKKNSGGLLANVSLLTTGGSSLQQMTNSDLQHSTDKKKKEKNTGKLSLKSEEQVNTSTPARSVFSNNIVYGFDLSPVHSYEMPVATGLSKASSKKSFARKKIDGRSGKDESKNFLQDLCLPLKKQLYSLSESRSMDNLDLQKKLEEQLFSESNSAPNFMQAPSVASSHQSRMSLRQSDDTETMMSQVYSQPPSNNKIAKSRTGSLKKSAKDFNSSPRSPNRVSPRKASKQYSHVQGSGYGMVSPWKSPIKAKPDPKPKSGTKLAPKKKTKKKVENSDFILDSALTALANVQEKKLNGNPYSRFEKVTQGTYKVNQDEQPPEISNHISNDLHHQKTFHPNQSSEYKSLQNRCNALEEECIKLKVGHDEVNKENFVLTAKLNKLVAVNESTDHMMKDSLNDDTRDLEVVKLKKEIFEQEKLLTGYQQENEKLYSEVSKLKVLLRENESAMFAENLKLKNRIAALKEENDTKDAVIKDKNILLSEKENIHPTRNASAQTQEQTLSSPSKLLAEKIKEIEDLKQKLLESAETEALLQDRENKLTKANDEVIKLQKEVINLKKELATLGTNSRKQQTQVVEELQHQVKELERNLLKARNGDHVKDVLYGNKEKCLLEDRCKQLEQRLKTQEEQFAENMRSLHQLYKNMTKDYEVRVEELSDQVKAFKNHQRINECAEKCSLEQHKLLSDENLLLRAENENLKQQLFQERKTNTIQASPAKIKKKGRTKNDSTYNPDYFIQKSPPKLPSVQATAASVNDSSKHIKDLNQERENLLKDLGQSRQMYHELKTSYDSYKESREGEVNELIQAHKTAFDQLEKRNTLLNEQLISVQDELTKSRMSLSTSSAREDALQLQIRNLLDELQETRRASPVAAFRHLDSLQAQIRMLNFRQKNREDKLDKVVASSADEVLKAEIRALHLTISEKNQLISKFQCELDGILRALESLQNSKRVH